MFISAESLSFRTGISSEWFEKVEKFQNEKSVEGFDNNKIKFCEILFFWKRRQPQKHFPGTLAFTKGCHVVCIQTIINGSGIFKLLQLLKI